MGWALRSGGVPAIENPVSAYRLGSIFETIVLIFGVRASGMEIFDVGELDLALGFSFSQSSLERMRSFLLTIHSDLSRTVMPWRTSNSTR